MIRGTTPTHEFVLPFDTSMCAQIKIIYAQDDKVILEKTASQCEMNGNNVSVKLSQEETFKFDCKKAVQIQVRVLTLGNEALTSSIKLVDVDKCLENEVLA